MSIRIGDIDLAYIGQTLDSKLRDQFEQYFEEESKIDERLSERFPKLQVGIFSTVLEAGHSLDFTGQDGKNERLLGVVHSLGMISQLDGSLIKVNKEDVVTEEGYEPQLTIGWNTKLLSTKQAKSVLPM